MKNETIRIPALEIRQGANQRIYCFGIDGKKLDEFTTVSRIKRSEEASLQGYQRPEVSKHIAGIREYLESGDPLFPNAIVIAFDGRVRFEPTNESESDQLSVPGILVVPVVSTGTQEEKPGWIVDGQQRVAAVRASRLGAFPLCATAFITDRLEEQTSQFMLINNTKPLPKGLLYELLPGAEGLLPPALMRRQYAACLMEHLSFRDARGPLFGRIKMPTNPDGIIKDNSILKTLENSLSDGAFYELRPGGPTPDEDSILATVNAFWSAVSKVFPEAWTLPPKESRLVHGAGVVSLGYLMDSIVEKRKGDRRPGQPLVSTEVFEKDLSLIEPICRWTSGTWNFERQPPREWNAVQNVSGDILLLSSYLEEEYRRQTEDIAP